jgi:hypothetical protein
VSGRGLLAAGIALAGVVGVMSQPRIPQDPGYHLLADQRAWLGVPNGLNVLSNLPFAIVGLWGLAATARGKRQGAGWLRVPWATLFGGTALTALGSSYYHLAPDNWGLAWDRLPMTVGFMGLLTAVLAERLGLALARRLFVPLVAAGAGSVVYWYWSELRGAGDLRPYALVQFGSLAAIALLLVLYRRPGGDDRYLVAALVAYAAAKGLEMADRAAYDLGQVVSGHTLKHVAAAAGIACLAALVARRNRLRTWPPQDGLGISARPASPAASSPSANQAVGLSDQRTPMRKTAAPSRTTTADHG